MTGVLSKSLGSQGGLVAGPDRVVEHLVDSARSFIFDTGLAPAAAGAGLAALELLRANPGLAGAVRARARDLHRIARAAGFDAIEPAGGGVRHPDRAARGRVGRARPLAWRPASGSAVSVRRRCPTAGADCG